jgi:hypothetical protein
MLRSFSLLGFVTDRQNMARHAYPRDREHPGLLLLLGRVAGN